MKAVKVLDERINIVSDSEKNHIVYDGAARVTQQVQTADSYSSSNCLFTFSPPSQQTVVDRKLKLKCYVEFKSDVDFDLGVNDAPTAFPLASIMESLQVSINGESISAPVSDYVHALLCYNNDAALRSKEWSTTPCMPDQYQQFSDWSIYGSARNALSDFGENSSEMSRGGFPYQLVDSRTIRFTFTEPLMISPMVQGGEQEGFSNVDQLSFSIRWVSDLSKAWSHSSLGNAMTSLTMSFTQAPEMLVTYLTPPAEDMIPAQISYPYSKYQPYIKTVPTMASGAITTVISDSIRLSQVPRKMYLFARRSRATSNYKTTNTFAAIRTVNLTWNNQSSLLSTASQQDLYQQSVDAGCNLSWAQFTKFSGSVHCIDFATAVGMGIADAPNSLGQYTFSLQVQLENVSSAAIDLEFFVLLENEGVFVIAPGMARASLGDLTGAAVEQAKLSAPMVGSGYHKKLMGGSFLGSLKNIVNKIAGVVSTVASPLSSINPAFGAIGQVASGVRDLTGGSKQIGGSRLALSRRR